MQAVFLAKEDAVRRTSTLALVFLIHVSLASAQPSPTTRLIPFSGTAVDDVGSPIAGPVSLTFELYEEEDGGAALWRETQRVDADARGRYLVYLGVVTPLPQSAFTQERARWLGVKGENHAMRRVMLVAVPYALRATDAETLGGQPASAFLRNRAGGHTTSAGVVAVDGVDGSGIPGQLAKFSSPTSVSSSVISESATNRIGVGLPDPTGGGVVDSVFTIRNFDNNTGFAVLNQSQARRFALNTLASGAWVLYDGGSGIWNQGLAQSGGRIGLGTTTPDAKLKVVQAVSTDAIVASAVQPGRHAFRGASPGGSIAVLGVISNNLDLNVFSNAAVYGYNELGGAGTSGFTTSGTTTSSGVVGASTSGTGVYGTSSSGLAGHFVGNVTVSGTLSKGGGAFKIDHPLDPTNKYLSHSFIESPDMMNVYNGNVTLDSSGEAWVALPAWFEALNRDFRYQLTAIGAPGPNLHVAARVTGNRFKIAGGVAGGDVSWQITGIRQDAWANAHRIAVEEEKPASERGSYLHSAEHGQPAPAPSVPQVATGDPKAIRIPNP